MGDDDPWPLHQSHPPYLSLCVSRCATGCTHWQQTLPCCWPTRGFSCSLTPWRRRRGPTWASCCPLSCPLPTERCFMTSSRSSLISGSRSGFTVSRKETFLSVVRAHFCGHLILLNLFGCMHILDALYDASFHNGCLAYALMYLVTGSRGGRVRGHQLGYESPAWSHRRKTDGSNRGEGKTTSSWMEWEDGTRNPDRCVCKRNLMKLTIHNVVQRLYKGPLEGDVYWCSKLSWTGFSSAMRILYKHLFYFCF